MFSFLVHIHEDDGFIPGKWFSSLKMHFHDGAIETFQILLHVRFFDELSRCISFFMFEEENPSVNFAV